VGYPQEVVPGILVEALVDREVYLLHGLAEVARVALGKRRDTYS